MRFTHDDYTVAWICALPIEIAAAKAILDEEHDSLPQPKTDHNVYTLGAISGHNVVLVCLPAGVYGTVSASTTVSHMVSTYPNIEFGLMVGIGGGVPREYDRAAAADIRLGDIVVSRPTGSLSGVVQYDYGKTVREGKLQRTGSLNKPPRVLLKAIAHLEGEEVAGKRQVRDILAQIDQGVGNQFPRPERDMLFKAGYYHENLEANCSACDTDQLVDRPLRSRPDEPYIHYGLIASGDQVMKDARTRDSIAGELDILCFEMEAAGVMDELPSLVIRGICDYCDSHKHKEWQPYAALAAAAYAKALLSTVPIIINKNRKPEKVGFTADEEACLQSLFLTDPEDDKNALRRRKGGRATGTCEWILETDELMDWLEISKPRGEGGSNVLWLHGNPGTGKSTMAMTMVDEIPRQQAFTKGSKVLVYFFCDSSSDKQRTAISILRGLIYYLVKQRPYLVKFLLAKYNERKESLNSSFDALWGILMEMGRDAAVEIYCIIDALDECESDSQQDLLRQIHQSFGEQQTAESSLSHLHLLITSRPYPEIGDYLSHFTNKDLASYSAVENDLRVMIEAKVEDLAARKKYPKSVKEEVSSILEDKAEGTFLWVGIACSELARPEVRSRNATRTLARMPPGLHALYKQLLNAALVERGDDEDEKETMGTMMKFVAFARRPLTVLELTALCGLYPDDDDDTRIQFTKELIELCRLIIVIQDEHVRLLHKSVKDFLVKEELDIEEIKAHADMANHCINHILDAIGIIGDEGISFLKYAIEYWPEHAANADTAWTVGPQQELFFEPDSRYWAQWQARYNAMMNYNIQNPWWVGFGIFHAAAMWNIIPLILWGLKANPEYNDDEFGIMPIFTPLVEAANEGHINVMRVLLNKMPVGVRVSALVIGAAARNEESGLDMMKLILDREGDHVQVTDWVLASAVGNANTGQKLLQLLLDQQGDQIEPNEMVGIAAMNCWHGKTIMGPLLDRYDGHMNITEELVQAAAMNRGDGRGVMEFLLDRQGDQLLITENIVRAAAYNEERGAEIIELLLEREGDGIPVTEAVIEAAARNSIAGRQILILLCGNEQKALVTEKVLKAAAANHDQGLEIMEFLLNECLETNYCVTPDVLTIALYNQPSAALASLLFERTHEQFDLTEDIWEAAIYNRYSTEHVQLLLQYNMHVVLTERLLMAISTHSWEHRKELIMLFLNAGSRCTVTKRVLDIIVRWFDADVMVLLLQQPNGQLRVTEQQITAAFPGDNRLRDQDISSLPKAMEPMTQPSRIALDLPTPASTRRFRLITQSQVLDDHDDEVWSSQFSQDGLSLRTVGCNGRVIVYKTKTWSIIHDLIAHTQSIRYVAYSHDDTRLAILYVDSLIQIWDTKTYECLQVLHGTTDANELHWVTNEEIIILTHYKISHWSTTGSCTYKWPNFFQCPIYYCCITPDGTQLLVSDARQLHVFDIKTRTKKISFSLDDYAPSFVVDPNSGHLLATLRGGEVQLLDFNLGSVICRYRGNKACGIRSTIFGSDNSLVISGSSDVCIYVWDRGSGALVDILEGPESGYVNSLSLNPSNPDMFASSGGDGTVRIWVRKTGELSD